MSLGFLLVAIVLFAVGGVLWVINDTPPNAEVHNGILFFGLAFFAASFLPFSDWIRRP